MSNTMPDSTMTGDEAVREALALAREALALTSGKEPWLFSLARTAEYTTRKHALLAYIEATL
jgi:hypothetical protein